MGIATGDLLQIIDRQTYLGEDVLNIYYYRWSSSPATGTAAYIELMEDFAEAVISPVASIQNLFLSHTTTQIKNLSNGVDFAERLANIDGFLDVAIGNTLPSYMALRFQLVRDSLVTRSGYKRYAGMIESQVEGNTYVGSLTPVGDIIGGLLSSLSVGIIQVAYPVIPKRPITVPAGDDYLYSSVVGSIFKGIGTQNTRKP